MDAIANALVSILAAITNQDTGAPELTMCFEPPVRASVDCMFVHDDNLFEIRPDGRIVILAYA